jgi:hypothetical protein
VYGPDTWAGRFAGKLAPAPSSRRRQSLDRDGDRPAHGALRIRTRSNVVGKLRASHRHGARSFSAPRCTPATKSERTPPTRPATRIRER